jgi:hypothetical protein
VSTLLAVSPGGSAWAAHRVRSSARRDLALENPLVVPSIDLLVEGQQRRAAEAARRASPEAFLARRASQRAYEHLDGAQARRLARSAFPALIDEPAGGPPPLSAGERVVRYLSANAAQLTLPGGERGVMETVQPIALQSSPRHYRPIDLHLKESANAFAPIQPAVGVYIPKRLSGGVRLGRTGVSLKPIDAHGSPLRGSAGQLDGASVIYANT